MCRYEYQIHFYVCWPCISIHPCNENQLDALFILSLFRQSTCTCFGYICSPSSGGKLYRVILYIYSTPPDDGLQIYPKHVEVDRRNKLRINGASSWCFITRMYQIYLRRWTNSNIIQVQIGKYGQTLMCKTCCGSRKSNSVAQIVCKAWIKITPSTRCVKGL